LLPTRSPYAYPFAYIASRWRLFVARRLMLTAILSGAMEAMNVLPKITAPVQKIHSTKSYLLFRSPAATNRQCNNFSAGTDAATVSAANAKSTCQLLRVDNRWPRVAAPRAPSTSRVQSGIPGQQKGRAACLSQCHSQKNFLAFSNATACKE